MTSKKIAWAVVGVLAFLALAPTLLHVFNLVETEDLTLLNLMLNLTLIGILGTLLGFSIKITILPSIMPNKPPS